MREWKPKLSEAVLCPLPATRGNPGAPQPGEGLWVLGTAGRGHPKQPLGLGGWQSSPLAGQAVVPFTSLKEACAGHSSTVCGFRDERTRGCVGCPGHPAGLMDSSSTKGPVTLRTLLGAAA